MIEEKESTDIMEDSLYNTPEPPKPPEPIKPPVPPELIKPPEPPELIKPTNQIKYVGNHYSGYKVQIMVTSKALADRHPIFESFDKIYLDRVDDNFVYLIGDFNTRDGAEQFMMDNVKSEFKDAFIVKYQEGKKD